MRLTTTIPRGPFDLAGTLYVPSDYSSDKSYPAIVLSTPGGSVKEQAAANYAARLSAAGFVALTFDPAHQGESGGEPRDLEDPYRRGEDISYAIDALATQPGVDPLRIGALGICAGGGYAVHTARTDHRIKALGTVVAADLGAAWRSAAMSPDGPAVALDDLAAERRGEVREAMPHAVQWLPETLADAAAAGITDTDTTAAITYYRTSRGAHENTTNRRLRRSDALLIGYDAFALIDELLTQPVSVVVAGRRGTTGQYETGSMLVHRARNAEPLIVIDGAGHYDMYDEPRYVDEAVEHLVRFYRKHL